MDSKHLNLVIQPQQTSAQEQSKISNPTVTTAAQTGSLNGNEMVSGMPSLHPIGQNGTRVNIDSLVPIQVLEGFYSPMLFEK